MANPSKTADKEPLLPELDKVVLLRVNCVHKPTTSGAKAGELKTKIRREMSLDLLEPLSKTVGCRLKIEVSVNGTWQFEKVDEPLITFQGDYEARFIFPVAVSMDQAAVWLENNFFCHAAIAQAIPVVNMHMYSQLEMMGLSTRGRAIGHHPSTLLAKDNTKSKTRAKSKVISKPVAQPVAKKPVAKKPVAKKPVAKKPVAKKPVAKKPVAKKPAE